jgi:hypothetical protein
VPRAEIEIAKKTFCQELDVDREYRLNECISIIYVYFLIQFDLIELKYFYHVWGKCGENIYLCCIN